jgi:hypothetical protein
MASLGVHVGNAGGSMLAETMVAFRGLTTVAGAAGRAVGGFGRKVSGGGAAGATAQAGFFQGGLAGIVSRSVTNSAVKTATGQSAATHTATHTASHTAQSASSVRSAHSASERQSTETARTDRQDQFSQVGHTVSESQQTYASHTTQQAAAKEAGAKETASRKAAPAASPTIVLPRQTSLGGAIYNNSLQKGGRFANDVIGMVARGDIRSTGSITGDMASQAMLSYTGLTALGENAVQKVSYSNVEIGGGRIVGTETTEAHPQGIAFGMYHAEQYTAPEGEYSKVYTADGSQWYKQYAVDTVVKTPFKAPDGEIDYDQKIVKRLPQPPKRKDRV